MGKFTHGHCTGKKSLTHNSWVGMIQRCTNPKAPDYKRYGGRGITICTQWLMFENFLKDMGERPPGKTLDRINNNLGYYKENCKWSTRSEQQQNKRNNKLYTYKNQTKCLMVWAKEYGLNYQTLGDRLNRLKWPIEKALTTPSRKDK